jgi:hypothetical protein
MVMAARIFPSRPRRGGLDNSCYCPYHRQMIGVLKWFIRIAAAIVILLNVAAGILLVATPWLLEGWLHLVTDDPKYEVFYLLGEVLLIAPIIFASYWLEKLMARTDRRKALRRMR